MARQMIDIKCNKCLRIEEGRYVDLADLAPCMCGGQFERVHFLSAVAVIGDDIPGGVLMKHGICHDDGTPRRFYSRTDIRRAAEAKGLEWGHDTNRHVTNPKMGTDKNAHTGRW